MRLAWFVILLAFPFANTFSQDTGLRGKVSDKMGRPLNFVSIWVDSTRQGALTNDEGFYRLSLKPGSYTLSFRSPGYEPSCQNITIGNTPAIYNLQLSRCTRTPEFPGDADSIIRMVMRSQKAGLDSTGTFS